MTNHLLSFVFVSASLTVLMHRSAAAEPETGTPSAGEVRAALDRAITFFHAHCSKQGGYDWRYSRDLSLTEGEGETGPQTVWVQPPGTPAVGLALLEAYDETGDARYLTWAQEAAAALVQGQLQSGGWYYRIEFAPQERRKWGYRDNDAFRPSTRRKNKTNITTLDDDTTPAALRLLMEVDRRLGFRDQALHEAAMFSLTALLTAQYPNGGWYQNWDTYPVKPSAGEFPVIAASYPEDWSRRWLNDWPGRYFINDNVSGTMIETMLLAWEVYDDEKYLDSAKACGEFLIRAQMPAPQPAWAQQYNPRMHPCWDRKFEPPAISTWESQFVIESLLLLYRKTSDTRFLQPIPAALAYLKTCLLPDNRLPRFLELRTNRPLYFDRSYQLTYDAKDMPDHYGFIQESRLETLQAEYDALAAGRGDAAPGPDPAPLAASEIRNIIAALDDRGAWIDPRSMRGHRKASPEGVIQSETFIHHTRTLCAWLSAHR